VKVFGAQKPKGENVSSVMWVSALSGLLDKEETNYGRSTRVVQGKNLMTQQVNNNQEVNGR